MPCHRCGARQTDPVRGASPWRRGVRRGEQVLVCPDCQRGRDWTAELAHCAVCGSARLGRALGRTECKDCGAEDQVKEAPGEPAGAGGDTPATERDGSPTDVSARGGAGDAAGDVVSSSPDADRQRLAAEVEAALERWRRA